MQEHQIIKLFENRLIEAMLSSNSDELDTLISDDLIFTDHTGSLRSKSEDIASHESGMVSIDSINCSDQKIRLLKEVAIVSVIMEISGVFGGNPASGKFRFTRIWQQLSEAKWHIISAHSTLLV